MKRLLILVLFLGVSAEVMASVLPIGHYKVLQNGSMELTTDSSSAVNPAVAKVNVESFLGITGLDGIEGSAVKGSINIEKDQVFSFDWVFTDSGVETGAFDDFSFVNIQLGSINLFNVLARRSSSTKASKFEWTATEAGVLKFGIGVMDLGDIYADSSLVISNLNPVPLPAAVWLFISGLLGFVGLRRKTTA